MAANAKMLSWYYGFFILLAILLGIFFEAKVFEAKIDKDYTLPTGPWPWKR